MAFKMNSHPDAFQVLVDRFPQTVRAVLESVPRQAGCLYAAQCEQLMRRLDLGIGALMVRLLPLACWYAVAPISHFQAGAVALGAKGKGRQDRMLFFGANMEFTGVALNQTIHAEQAAVVNAWHHGAEGIEALAVSDAPCGCCRQFLFETHNGTMMRIVTPTGRGDRCRSVRLADLLPEAFSPAALGREPRLMACRHEKRVLRYGASAGDRVAAEAGAAAERSYAPYTRNYAGCAVQLESGKIYSGRCAESAAYNPGLTALQCAIIMAHTAQVDRAHTVRRAVLVERPTTASQHISSDVLLQAWARGVELECIEAEPAG
jgi:cytidine deaminase